jgi:hypothetical protein
MITQVVLASTSSRMATTRKSSSEFLHPTIIPGEDVLGISSGQKIRIRPPCSGMTGTPTLRRILDVEVVPGQIFQLCRIVDAKCHLADRTLVDLKTYTKFVSREATLSTGIMTKKNNIDSTAKPLAARAYVGIGQIVST